MVKRLIYIAFAFLAVTACMIDVDRDNGTAGDGFPLNGKPVTVTFSIPNVKVASPTKGITDDGTGLITGDSYLDPEKLFLVVCGSNQSIKYIRKAKLEEDKTVQMSLKYINDNSIEGYPVAFPDEDPTGENTFVTLYTFSVQLEVSDQPRTIHFLGNIDESQLISGYSSFDILPFLMSYPLKQAYWQKLVMPHIMPEKDSHDNYVIDQTTGSYKLDPSNKAYLQYIPLIRNFAEIHLSNTTHKDDGSEPQFLLHSYAVIYYPTRGTVTPYRSNTTGINEKFDFKPSSLSLPSGYRLSGYEKCNFELLESMDYAGNLPTGVPFNRDVPSKAEFLHPETSTRVLASGSTECFQVYERGVPTATLDPTFVIICGRARNENVDNDEIDPDNDQLYFYRLDLMETKLDPQHNTTVAQYYPLYRNFRYDIQLTRVTSKGVDDPQLAVESTGAYDISKDVSMRYLSDISNGISRLVVEPFMAWTYTGPKENGYYELYARFFNNPESDVPNTRPTAVQVTLEDIGGDIIKLYNDNETQVSSFYPRSQQRVDASGQVTDGWRVIRFNVIEPLSTTKTQKIKITGWNDEHDEQYPLFREVEITLQQRQEMQVKCETRELPRVSGSLQTVSISIPDGLPQSMFPINFILEAEDLTLTPDTNRSSHPDNPEGYNLPVRTGESISDRYAGKTTFQFIRTLTREEYESLAPADGMRTFECYFKSNRSQSATTVWVWDEHKYFYRSSDYFTNRSNMFIGLAFTKYISRGVGASIPVSFEVASEELPAITVNAVGMTIDGQTTYTFTPTQPIVTLNFTSTVDNGDVSLTISADGYESASIWSHYFNIDNLGFIDGIKSSSGQSNVVFGYVNVASSKVVPFGFKADPDFIPDVTLRNLNDENVFTALSYSRSNGIVSVYQNVMDDEGYREIEFKTGSNTDPLGFRLTAPGYVEETVPTAGRLTSGNIRNWQAAAINNSNVLKPGNSYNFGGTKNKFFVYTQDSMSAKVEFDRMPELNASTGLWLKPSTSGVEDTFTMTVNTENDAVLFYVEITFANVGYEPGSLTAKSDDNIEERVWKYPGTNERRFIWNLAKEDKSHSHTLTLKSDHDVNIRKIVIKAIDGGSYQDPE